MTCVLQVTIYGMGGRGTTLLDNVDVTVDRRANGALVLVDDSVRLLELAMMNFSAVASLRMLFLGCFLRGLFIVVGKRIAMEAGGVK